MKDIGLSRVSRSRGAIYGSKRQVMALADALLEHPATRPHLDAHKLAFRMKQETFTIVCTTCNEDPCTCPTDPEDNVRGFILDLYHDPALRPIFTRLELTVVE